MAKSSANTVEEYLAELSQDRREAIGSVREVIVRNLPDGYEESMQFGMIGYCIPLERFPKTYNGHPLMYCALASQKNYMSLYLMNVYGDEETQRWFIEEYTSDGRKLNMGKSCVRFKKVDDLPLDLIGQAIALTSVEDYIKMYEGVRRR